MYHHNPKVPANDAVSPETPEGGRTSFPARSQLGSVDQGEGELEQHVTRLQSQQFPVVLLTLICQIESSVKACLSNLLPVVEGT